MWWPCETLSGAPGAHITGRARPPRASLGGRFSPLLDCRRELGDLPSRDSQRIGESPHRAECRHVPAVLDFENRLVRDASFHCQRLGTLQPSCPPLPERFHKRLPPPADNYIHY